MFGCLRFVETAAYDFGGYACYDGVRGRGAGYYGSGSHYGTARDGYAFEYGDVTADPYVFAYYYVTVVLG